MVNRIAAICLATLMVLPTQAATLWSNDKSYLGPGLFFGPGALPQPAKLFGATIRRMAFHTDIDFVTPFLHNGTALPNVPGPHADFDGTLVDGTKVNENVTLGAFMLAGVRMMPFVARTGAFRGQQISVTQSNGDMIMMMDLVLDIGIGERGLIKVPFYGTTGTLTIPRSLQSQSGGRGVDRAGPLQSGETISGRIGDFNGDGYIDGTIVAVGVMPLDSPVFPGQPYALSRNFETDIALEGTVMGSPLQVHEAYQRRKR